MKSMNAKQCKDLLETGEYELIDVRSFDEHMDARIDNVQKHLPLDEINSWARELDKSKKYIIYCRSGARSGFATQNLEILGLEVINLEGGIMAWASLGFEINSD